MGYVDAVTGQYTPAQAKKSSPLAVLDCHVGGHHKWEEDTFLNKIREDEKSGLNEDEREDTFVRFSCTRGGIRNRGSVFQEHGMTTGCVVSESCQNDGNEVPTQQAGELK